MIDPHHFNTSQAHGAVFEQELKQIGLRIVPGDYMDDYVTIAPADRHSVLRETLTKFDTVEDVKRKALSLVDQYRSFAVMP